MITELPLYCYFYWVKPHTGTWKWTYISVNVLWTTGYTYGSIILDSNNIIWSDNCVLLLNFVFRLDDPTQVCGTGEHWFLWGPLHDQVNSLTTQYQIYIMESYYVLLGLEPHANLDEIKKSYRTLAKLYHPDKNIGNNTTELFQRLNSAYHTLTNPIMRREYDATLGLNTAAEEHSVNNSNYTLNARENTQSVTIDITDTMFLVILEESERHHSTKPIDRGHHGLQLRAPYVSPSDQTQYGNISLTFYPSTSRLLVQGSSYMLWVEEHLPLIYHSAEAKYLENALKWCNLATEQHIGRNKNRSTNRGRTKQEPSSSSEVIPVALCLSPSPTAAPPLPPSNDRAENPEPMMAQDAGEPTKHRPITVTETSQCPHTQAVPRQSLSDDTTEAKAVNQASLAVHPPGLDIAPTRSSPGSGTQTVSDGLQTSKDKRHTQRKQKPKRKSKEPKKRTQKPKTKPVKPDIIKIPSPKDGCSKNSATPKDTVQAPVSSKYCKQKCPYNGVHQSEMIRCSTCMHWYHTICAGEEPDYVGVWCCQDCRTMPATLKGLQLQMGELITCMREVQTRQGDQETLINQLKTENANLRNKMNHTQSQNEELIKLINTMSDESTHPRTASASHDEDGQSWSKVTSSNRFAVLANLDDESCDITMSQDVPHRRTSLPHKSPKCKAKKKTVHWDDNIVNVTQTNPPSTSQPIPDGPANPDAAPMPSRHSSADTRKNPVKVMVIGSSNARGVAPLVSNNHIDATGFVYPGCTAGQITDRIQSIHCSGVTVIHAGTNNLEAQPLAKCMA